MQGLSDAQKLKAQQALDVAFNSFKRNIVVYAEPKKVVTQSKQGFNFAYPEQGNPQAVITYIPNSGVIEATIEYMSSAQAQKESFATEDTRFVESKGVVLICVRDSGRQMIEGAERIEFDGHNHFSLTDSMPRGIFSPDYYNIWLQRAD